MGRLERAAREVARAGAPDAKRTPGGVVEVRQRPALLVQLPAGDPTVAPRGLALRPGKDEGGLTRAPVVHSRALAIGIEEVPSLLDAQYQVALVAARARLALEAEGACCFSVLKHAAPDGLEFLGSDHFLD